MVIVCAILGHTTFSSICLFQFLINDKTWSSTMMVWKDALLWISKRRSRGCCPPLQRKPSSKEIRLLLKSLAILLRSFLKWYLKLSLTFLKLRYVSLPSFCSKLPTHFLSLSQKFDTKKSIISPLPYLVLNLWKKYLSFLFVNVSNLQLTLPSYSK